MSFSCDAIDTQTHDGWRSAADRELVAPERAREVEDMITFLAWWTSAAIIAGSGVTAWFVHLNYRAH